MVTFLNNNLKNSKRRNTQKYFQSDVLLLCDSAEDAAQLYLAMAYIRSINAADIAVGLTGGFDLSYSDDYIGNLKVIENIITFTYASLARENVRVFLEDIKNEYVRVNVLSQRSVKTDCYSISLIEETENARFKKNPLYLTVG